jgi:hypothetical protein
MADVVPALIPMPEDQPPQPRDIKLPPLWSMRPGAWFTFVESHFWLRGINDQMQNFNHILSALPAEMVSQVIHLVDTLRVPTRTSTSRCSCSTSMPAIYYQKFDILTKMEPMGCRKPSQKLLHAMLEFCPFWDRESPLLSLLLHSETSPGSQNAAGKGAAWQLCALATRANKLWSVHSAAKGGTVPAAEAEETAQASIVTIRGGNRGRGGRSSRQGGTRGGRCRPCSYGRPCRRSYSLRPCQGLFQTLSLPLGLRGQGEHVSRPLLLGKLGRQGRLNHIVPCSMVHLVDQLSNRHFLVDTGASYSIVPHQSSSPPSGPRLRSAAGQLSHAGVQRR